MWVAEHDKELVEFSSYRFISIWSLLPYIDVVTHRSLLSIFFCLADSIIDLILLEVPAEKWPVKMYTSLLGFPKRDDVADASNLQYSKTFLV